jgi:hypothetical protein
MTMALVANKFPFRVGSAGQRLLLVGLVACAFGCTSATSPSGGSYTAARSVQTGSHIPQPSSAANATDTITPSGMESSGIGQNQNAAANGSGAAATR